MDSHEFLKRFQKVLQEEEYDSSIVKHDDLVEEKLLVFLGLDEKERERVLEITAIRQEFIKGIDPVNELKEPDILRMQFLVPFPFTVQEEASTQMTSLICYLNRLIELPGFEIDEVNLRVYYRHVFMYGEEKLNKKLFTSLVGLTMLLLELFGATLEKVATGETTFNDLLEQIVHLSKNL